MKPRKGRGTVSNADGRYEPTTHVVEDDGWGVFDVEPPSTQNHGDE